jgi:hypothetical protein
MRNRIYKPKRLFKKYTITQNKIDKIRYEAKESRKILNSKFLTSYLEAAQKDILETHALQSIYDSQEEYKMGETIRRLFFPAKKEYTMLAGEYRFIDRFVGDLKQAVSIAESMEEKLNSGELEVNDEV